MIKLYSPHDLAELASIESILEGERIPYFIHNDHFGSLEIGPQIDINNKKTIMVNQEYQERAKELIFETLVFTWFIPGRHRKRLKNEKEET